MKIITLEEFLNQNSTEPVVVEVVSLKEAKQIKKTEQLFGIIVCGLVPATIIDFCQTKCSSFKEHEDIQKRITKENIFIRTKNTKVKYFLSNGQNIIAKSFEKKISESWGNFYLETLTKVFGPEA